MPHFLDTNILLYSISTNPQESFKRQRVIELLKLDDNALSVQVLQEFYAQATRASRIDPLPHELAVALIESWTRFSIQDMNIAVLRAALEIRQSHRFSFWESTIIAAALALGCKRLYSEDLSHGQSIGGLIVLNPFLA